MRTKYRIVIEKNNQDLTVQEIALVDEPAVEIDFLYFNKQEKPKPLYFNEEQMIVAGVLMLPDKLIYRYDEEMGEYDVFFTPEDIENARYNFKKYGLTGQFNEGHTDKKVNVVLIEDYILDEGDTRVEKYGFKDLPKGTWFGITKVEDYETWTKIKSGELRGFSVEGLFQLKQTFKKESFIVEPNPGETKDDFIGRCIGIEIDGGMDENQAAAVCYTKWEDYGLDKLFNLLDTNELGVSKDDFKTKFEIHEMTSEVSEYFAVSWQIPDWMKPKDTGKEITEPTDNQINRQEKVQGRPPVYYFYDKRPGAQFDGAGIIDARSRDFCIRLVNQNKYFTEADIEKMSLTAGFDVFLYAGGKNCRHNWFIAIPIVEEFRHLDDDSDENTYCVYRHIREDKNEVFYIGMSSNEKRPYEVRGHNKYWHNITNKTPYRVDIMFRGLTKDEAIEKEIEMIALYGRKDLGFGTLCNKNDGGSGGHNLGISKYNSIKKDVFNDLVNGLSETIVSIKYGITKGSIHRIKKEFDFQYKRPEKKVKDKKTRSYENVGGHNKGISKYDNLENDIIDCIEKEMSYKEIQDRFYISRGAIYRIKQKLNKNEVIDISSIKNKKSKMKKTVKSIQKFVIETELQNGTEVIVDADELVVGARVEVKVAEQGDVAETDMYQPAPDGEHILADGTVITTEGGVITSITPATPADETTDEVEAGKKREKMEITEEDLVVIMEALQPKFDEIMSMIAELASKIADTQSTETTEEDLKSENFNKAKNGLSSLEKLIAVKERFGIK